MAINIVIPTGAARSAAQWRDLLVKPNFEKAKALLKEAGYDGSPVVLMQSTTLPVLTNMAPVTKSLLEQAGFKVDMQSMDWQTVVTRRTKKDPAAAEMTASTIAHARLSWFDDCGHSPFIEDAARFNDELAAFVEGATRS